MHFLPDPPTLITVYGFSESIFFATSCVNLFFDVLMIYLSLINYYNLDSSKGMNVLFCWICLS